MLPVAAHREALAELVAAALYYDRQVPGLGADFLIRYDELVVTIRERPRLPREIRRSVGKARLKRFPYAIYFELLADRIHILAVAHQHRRPYYWQSRLAK